MYNSRESQALEVKDVTTGGISGVRYIFPDLLESTSTHMT
jgi:hypothetical protein